jgi:hypothetical protein
MSILDDAIREHLELKRAHGADDAELKRLEDEAFGPPQRPDQPDPFAEAPTEFLVAPETGAKEQGDEAGGRRTPNIADLQEAPEAPRPQEAAEPDDGPAEEEHPAKEHEAIAEPGHSTEERHAIASQPTEVFDVEEQFEDAATEAGAPSDEELIEAEQGEPRVAPPAEEEPADEFDEFFHEQRLSDELNQALEAPLPDEPGLVPAEDATGFAGPADEVVEDQADLDEDRAEPADRAERDSTSEFLLPKSREESEAAAPPAEDSPPPAAPIDHEDVLEDTPEFLEESPEDDDLWFEQKPPKDIDFGD